MAASFNFEAPDFTPFHALPAIFLVPSQAVPATFFTPFHALLTPDLAFSNALPALSLAQSPTLPDTEYLLARYSSLVLVLPVCSLYFLYSASAFAWRSLRSFSKNPKMVRQVQFTPGTIESIEK